MSNFLEILPEKSIIELIIDFFIDREWVIVRGERDRCFLSDSNSNIVGIFICENDNYEIVFKCDHCSFTCVSTKGGIIKGLDYIYETITYWSKIGKGNDEF